MEEITQRGASYFILIPKYYFADEIKENEVGEACGRHWRGEDSLQGFGRKPEGKISLGKPRRRWEDGIRMDRR
jgi:hypothetical protein